MLEWVKKLDNLQKNLLDSAFGVANYHKSFPHVFCCDNQAFVYKFPKEGAECESVCACYPLVWQSKKLGLLHGLCLGSVATQPCSLGKGSAGAVLKQALAAAENLGFDFVFLFSNVRTLYTSLGFEPVVSDRLLRFSSLTFSGKIAAENLPCVRRFYLAELSINELATLWRFVSLTSARSMPVLSWLEFKSLSKIEHLSVFLSTKSSAHPSAHPSSTSSSPVEWEGRSMCAGRLMQEGISAICFYEKGADFKNTLYGFSSVNGEDSVELAKAACKTLCSKANVHPSEILILPEAHANFFSSKDFDALSNDVFMMVKNLKSAEFGKELINEFVSGGLQVRALQSC